MQKLPDVLVPVLLLNQLSKAWTPLNHFYRN